MNLFSGASTIQIGYFESAVTSGVQFQLDTCAKLSEFYSRAATTKTMDILPCNPVKNQNYEGWEWEWGHSFSTLLESPVLPQGVWVGNVLARFCQISMGQNALLTLSQGPNIYEPHYFRSDKAQSLGIF